MAKKGKDGDARAGGMGARARDIFTISNLARLPSNLATVRKFINVMNWKAAQEEIAQELGHRVAILGMANSGKSTLFNTLRGTHASPVSAEEGTTKTLVRGQFGPFALIDTPGHLPDLQNEAIEEAAAIVYLLDASQGIRPGDVAAVTKLRNDDKPLVVALNKSDMLRDSADEAAAEAAARLHIADVIPISGKTGENIGQELIPAIIETSPEAALALGRMLPQYRREAADRIVRHATLFNLVAGMEPIPLIDIPVLLSTQIRMVFRVAALYNEPLGSRPTRELIVTIGGGLFFRYLAEEAAKVVPFGGDLVSGAIAGAGTWALGHVAIEYFEGGKQLTAAQLRELFARFYRRYREENPDAGRASVTPARDVVVAGEG